VQAPWLGLGLGFGDRHYKCGRDLLFHNLVVGGSSTVANTLVDFLYRIPMIVIFGQQFGPSHRLGQCRSSFLATRSALATIDWCGEFLSASRFGVEKNGFPLP
jgi:hypothetical protein